MKIFGWDITIKRISGDNPKLYFELMKMRLQDIFDYLVVSKRDNQIEKWKSSKNLIAM